MGIRGLTGWIRWAAPKTVSAPNWPEYQNTIIGIDILGFLYKAKARKECPYEYLALFIVACKQLQFTPVIIFDGKPPDAKRPALIQRAETRDLKRTDYFTSEERDVCKQICYAAGILCLNASGEADDVLAYFSRKGYFKAVISSDLDLLPRGVETLIVPEGADLPGALAGWRTYTLSAILATVDMTYNKFVEMCVLMGCDYTTGQKSLPYKSACWAIKNRRDMLKILETMGVLDETPYTDSIRRLKGELQTRVTLMGEKQWEKWEAGPPLSEYEALSRFRTTHLATLSDEDFLLLSTQTPQ